jgi:membrane protein implicated in regulation of membrane protease activity
LTAVYVVAFVVGGIAVLASLLLAEIGGGGADAGAGHGASSDGMPFLSLTSISAALLGAGAGGLIATWAGLGAALTGGIAIASAAVLLLLLQGLALPYLRRQQSNSHTGRLSYIGRLGTVTLDIPVDGWGEISFVDPEGNRVRSRAVTDEPEALLKSARVYISDVEADAVRVVGVPDPDPPPERH